MFWRCKEVFKKLNALAHEFYEKKLIAEKTMTSNFRSFPWG